MPTCLQQSNFAPPPPQQMMWFKSPPNVYFGCGTTVEALRDLHQAGLKRCFILTDHAVFELGFTKQIIEKLDELDISYEIFSNVTTASSKIVSAVVKYLTIFNPDCMIAMGGGSVIDVAKVCRVLYDTSNPHTELEHLYPFDHLQLVTGSEKQKELPRLLPCDTLLKKLICVPTTSSTGSEMSPIAWVMQEPDSSSSMWLKRPIVSFRMIPEIAIIDGFYTTHMSKDLAASGGMAGLARALESAVSRFASDYTIALSVRAAKLFFEHLPSSVHDGNMESRTHCHNAASIAGLAAGNAFVGMAQALTIALQQFLEAQRGSPVSLGAVSGLVLPQVIRYNASHCQSAERTYALVVEETIFMMNAREGIETDADKVEVLIEEVKSLRKMIGLPEKLSQLIGENEFKSSLDLLAGKAMAVVGCAATNPVKVDISHVKKILLAAYADEIDSLCT